MLTRRSHLQRYVAATALFGVGFGAFESAVGLVGDGLAYYESAGEAVEHVGTPPGDVGFDHTLEDVSDTRAPEHGRWTSPCHCAHAHGLAILTVTPAASTPVKSQRVVRIDRRIPDQNLPDPVFHPPKA